MVRNLDICADNADVEWRLRRNLMDLRYEHRGWFRDMHYENDKYWSWDVIV